MKINPNTYYKIYYDDHYSIWCDDHYSIWCTDNECAYVMAYKFKNKPLEKCNKVLKRYPIDRWEEFLNIPDITFYNYNIGEISKEDVFLELL